MSYQVFELWCDRDTGYPACMSTPENIVELRRVDDPEFWQDLYHRCDVVARDWGQAKMFYDSLWDEEPFAWLG